MVKKSRKTPYKQKSTLLDAIRKKNKKDDIRLMQTKARKS